MRDLSAQRRVLRREISRLTLLVATVVASFFLTRAAAGATAASHRRDARSWYRIATRTPAPDAAVRLRALRRAVADDPQNREYRLAFAAAMEESDNTNEAVRILTDLREAGPEDSPTNLALARLEARRHNIDASRRYYQNVLSELWLPGQAAQRRTVRLELVDMLLAGGEPARALPELLTLTSESPNEPALRAELGERLLRAGDARRAREQFVLALAAEPGRPEALAGAGLASFALGDYRSAHQYLSGAPEAADTRDVLNVTREFLARDPLERRIGRAERRRRAAGLLERAAARLEECIAAQNAAARLGGLRRDADALQRTLAHGREDSRDLSEEAIDVAYRMEAAADEVCGAARAPADRAILLLGRRNVPQ